MKKILLIALLVVLFAGCNKKEVVDGDDKSKQPDQKEVDDSKVKPLTNIKGVVTKDKLITGYNLLKDKFSYPKTGESMKRSLSKIDKNLPIKIHNTENNQSYTPADWYKIELDGDGNVIEYIPVGDITSDKKFEKDTVYAIQVVYELDEGYTILSHDNANEYNLAEDYIKKSFQLNGAPNVEFRIPDPTTGPAYSATFIFPKTK
ncbi:MAG: hypothetical protein GX864_03280 [Mollicutes bacterium]|jgi:hypothetical protein|nr:hypothetical protein [Mollicutes bacterium]